MGASRGMEAGNRAVEDFAGWELRDPLGRRVGRVSRVFSDPSGRAVQVEVSMGPLGLRKVLLPVNGVRVDRKDRALLLGRAHGRSAPPGRDAKVYRTGWPIRTASPRLVLSCLVILHWNSRRRLLRGGRSPPRWQGRACASRSLGLPPGLVQDPL